MIIKIIQSKNIHKYDGKEIFLSSVTDPLIWLENLNLCGSFKNKILDYVSAIGLEYVRNDDSVKNSFNAPPVIVNYFYHEEIKKSARKI